MAHNAAFDRDVIEQSLRRVGRRGAADHIEWGCTVDLSRIVWPYLDDHKLPTVCQTLGFQIHQHHDATADATACAAVGIDQEVALAQSIVDAWLRGDRLREIEEEFGRELGTPSGLLGRLRRNGLAVPSRSRGRGAPWIGPVPTSLQVEARHLGARHTMVKDTPPGARVVVFTGSSASSSRAELERLAVDRGWVVRNSVSSRTAAAAVVVCDAGFVGGKVLKARELGVPCITTEEFTRMSDG